MAYRRYITTAACAFAATVAAFGTALNDLPGTAEVYTASETDAAIRRLAPEPGNYLEVSNRAMSAIQTLAPATGYVDSVTQDLRAFAGSNAVTRLITPDGLAWQDATGVVWRIGSTFGQWTVSVDPPTQGIEVSNIRWDEWYAEPNTGRIQFDVGTPNGHGGPDYEVTGPNDSTEMQYTSDFGEPDAGIGWTITFTRSLVPGGSTNAVRQVAYTNDIPSTNGLASAAALGELSSRVLAVEQGEIPALYIKIGESSAAATNYTDSATNALAASMLSRSEAEAGFTAWTITPAKYGDDDIVLLWKTAGDGFQYDGWVPYPAGSPMNIGRPMGTADATNLVWRENEDAFMDIIATRTRLRPTPEMEAAWSAKQDALTIDPDPEPTSDNPVASGGVYNRLTELGLAINGMAQNATNAAEAVVREKISTNNAAFVSAVLAVPLTGADAGDLADIAEYGSYGTVGAAILALIAGLAALKRDKANKAELPYPFVPATVTQDGPRLPASAFPIAGSYDGTAFSLAESDITIAENESTGDWMVLAYSGSLTICVYTSAGAFSAAGTNITNLTFGGESTPPSMEFPNVLTITPRTVATYTAGTTAAAFSIAVGTGTNGAARDCVLVVDCTANGAVAPTVTWLSNFHPRTDAEEIAPVAGVRNVFYISEYATGEFVVGGWHEEVA